MKTTRLLIPLLFCLGWSAVLAQETIISGKLVGENGEPMHQGHVALIHPSLLDPVSLVTVEPDGSFSITTDAKGLFELRLSGVGHMEHSTGIILDTADSIVLTGQLRQLPYLTRFDSIGVIGAFNDYSVATAVAMTRDSGGVFSVEIESDAPYFSYQLVGLTPDGAIEAPGAESYHYDGGHSYRSVIQPVDGRVRITFDSAMVVRSAHNTQITFGDPTQQEFGDLYSAILNRRGLYQRSLAAHRKAGRSLESFSYNWNSELRRLSKKAGLQKDSLLRGAFLVSYLELATLDAAKQIDPKMAAAAIMTIPPASPLWSINPRLIPLAIEKGKIADAVRDNYIADVIDCHKDPNVTSLLLYDGLTVAYSTQQIEKAKAYYTRLTTSYSDSHFAAIARAKFQMP